MEAEVSGSIYVGNQYRAQTFRGCAIGRAQQFQEDLMRHGGLSGGLRVNA